MASLIMRNTRAIAPPARRLRGVLAASAVALAGALAIPSVPAVSAAPSYLDMTMTNRDASTAPGGLNPALPTTLAPLTRALGDARRAGTPAKRYATLLQQYWLVRSTERAGIDLAAWNPRAGVGANYDNLNKSYALYEQLQLQHRELRWAGQGGQVGADFGGGLLDFEMAGAAFSLPGLQGAVNEIDKVLTDRLGPQAISLLPTGMAALLRAARTITPQDLNWSIGMILVMQKNIYSDLMPMHIAYSEKGIAALEEMHRAGLFDDAIMAAWRDVASGDEARITAGNAALLRREQRDNIGAQWDQVRRYKGDVGEAITYLSTVAGSPSVAGVIPLREYRPVRYTVIAQNGKRAVVTLPLPSWNWSVFSERWDYITEQLVPKYQWTFRNDWASLERTFRTPYEVQMQSHRPIASLPQMLTSLVNGLKVDYP
ncbi:hypothetical protein [Tsukamurella ocularis]|uniref:hypothetical protein n=1 Tax=Tsukamurella ocularis TaxID=1970234 RepID=UPI0021673A1B|nr:hypothetical protein [Tsukamurella ocularis]MCS3782124.1 hypothetical protein [Tsukamurella ocularis]MCS3789716.1 hypothetical protein [Tsukamurella ocularis]MCS3852863.1 hypothetical protein [Tsukamurella ocularis]